MYYVLLPLLASVTVVCSRSDRRHPADRCWHLERPQLPEEGAGKYKRLRALLAQRIHQPRKEWPRGSHRSPSTSGKSCRSASWRLTGGGRVCPCACPCPPCPSPSSSRRPSRPCCKTLRQNGRHVATTKTKRIQKKRNKDGLSQTATESGIRVRSESLRCQQPA